MGLFKKFNKQFTPEYKRIEEFKPPVEKLKSSKEELLWVVEKLHKLQEEILEKVKANG